LDGLEGALASGVTGAASTGGDVSAEEAFEADGSLPQATNKPRLNSAGTNND
jgi:hypothetical protein